MLGILRQKPWRRQQGWILTGLQCEEAAPHALSGFTKIKTDADLGSGLKTPQTFAKKDRGASKISPFQMQVRHSHLQDSLKDGPHRPPRLVPELLEAVMAWVPLAGIEQLDRFLQA